MVSNTERGKAFQLLCRDALKRAFNRDFELELDFQIADGKSHPFDLATKERDIIAECKAIQIHEQREQSIRQEYGATVGGGIPRCGARAD